MARVAIHAVRTAPYNPVALLHTHVVVCPQCGQQALIPAAELADIRGDLMGQLAFPCWPCKMEWSMMVVNVTKFNDECARYVANLLECQKMRTLKGKRQQPVWSTKDES